MREPVLPAYGEPFDITTKATVVNTKWRTQQLAKCIHSDSTVVLRMKKGHPGKSQHILFYKISETTDEYPPTDDVIILTDELANDTVLWDFQGASLKMRVFKIADSMLPAELESRNQSYVFYLDKKLHAYNVYVPDSLYGEKTYHYFLDVAALLKREPINPMLVHTKGKHLYGTGNNSSDASTSLYMSSRTASVGIRRVNTGYYEDFYFRNTGDDPVMINQVKNNWSGYGCRVELPGETVMPGAKGRIRVFYRVTRTGAFRNEVKVYTNTKGSPYYLTISGTATN